MRHFRKIILIVLLSNILLACSYRDRPTEEFNPRVFSIATRQLPPQPPFASTRWVRPPQVTPDRDAPAISDKMILPIVHYKVTNTPLCEAALVLAATTRYQSFCSSLLAGQSLSFDGLGTLDELAIEIAMLAGVEIIVDHRSRHIRFLSKSEV